MIINKIKKPNIKNDYFDKSVLNVDCGEIPLADYECCNLAELYLNNIESPEQLTRCATLLYKTQKAVAALDFLHEETNKIVHKNMRLGLGVTGICQSIHKIDWLDKCYQDLKAFDKEWSKKKGYNESIKLTTIKPSGCGVIDTKIKTNNGIMSYEDIFKYYDIDAREYPDNLNGVWFDLSNNQEDPIKVYDKNNDEKCITKLFINGTVDVYEFKTEDGKTHQFTGNHKFLIDRNNKHEWVMVKDLKKDDEIISF